MPSLGQNGHIDHLGRVEWGLWCDICNCYEVESLTTWTPVVSAVETTVLLLLVQSAVAVLLLPLGERVSEYTCFYDYTHWSGQRGSMALCKLSLSHVIPWKLKTTPHPLVQLSLQPFWELQHRSWASYFHWERDNRVCALRVLPHRLLRLS